MDKNFKETSKSGGLIWLFQRVSAIILFFLLMAHYVTYHFIGHGVVKYADVIEKMKAPWFNLVQFLFLFTALYHGINGIWMVAEDYMKKKGTRIFVFTILVLLGAVLMFVGMLTIFKAGATL
ncbi:MAG: succinate dehydrogenase, hydrophobic membrane anchor protein [Acidobacteriota bacterium]